MTTSEILGFTVIAAIVSAVGAFAGLVLKETIFSRAFERWKIKHELENTHRNFRDPLVLSAMELLIRLEEILSDYPPNLLTSNTSKRKLGTTAAASIQDKNFYRYKMMSSVFRVCAFLGWLELYRQRLVFLSGGDRGSKGIVAANKAIREIRSAFADGHLNQAADWETWSDFPIYREQLRAIGETMIVDTSGSRAVLGYAEFSRMYEKKSIQGHFWIVRVKDFFGGLKKRKDFRFERLRRLTIALVDLIEALDKARLSKRYKLVRESARKAEGGMKYLKPPGR